jgi:hypothetical protein
MLALLLLLTLTPAHAEEEDGPVIGQTISAENSSASSSDQFEHRLYKLSYRKQGRGNAFGTQAELHNGSAENQVYRSVKGYVFYEQSLGGPYWMNAAAGAHNLDDKIQDEEGFEYHNKKSIPYVDVALGFQPFENVSAALKYTSDFVYTEWMDPSATLLNIRAHSVGLESEGNFGERWRARAELKNSFIHDGNQQGTVDASLMQDYLGPGLFWVGLGTYYNAFAQTKDDYWSPRRAQSFTLRTELKIPIARNFFGEAQINCGPSFTKNNPRTFDYFAQARAYYKNARQLELGITLAQMKSFNPNGNWSRHDLGLNLAAPL